MFHCAGDFAGATPQAFFDIDEDFTHSNPIVGAGLKPPSFIHHKLKLKSNKGTGEQVKPLKHERHEMTERLKR
jgi:hypothetical protein